MIITESNKLSYACDWEGQKATVLQEREVFKFFCFSDRQLSCPSSNWELNIDQVVSLPTKHNFLDLANGLSLTDLLNKSTVT